ncbi:MAG: UDP-2,3-diacylglucosamine diphosphatase LpxI [Deltaproteobacteria bacterium]|nr:UDP-2,3-diacylglucosamine diphosphatase LpxI [Deltaproteobacteria bacterium]
MSTGPGVLGLIAGGGAFPLDVARSARRQGWDVVAIAFHDHTDPALDDAASVSWFHPGEVGAALEVLQGAGVCDAVMAGGMPKTMLHGHADVARLDDTARTLLAGADERSDVALLNAVADFLGRSGIRLLPQTALVPELLAGEGPLGRRRATPAELDDIAFGSRVAKAVAKLGFGQTVVVKDGCVLARPDRGGRLRRQGRVARAGSALRSARDRPRDRTGRDCGWCRCTRLRGGSNGRARPCRRGRGCRRARTRAARDCDF